MMPKDQTFTLPIGLVLPSGKRLRRGRLRPIQVREERELLKDFRVYLEPDQILLLALEKSLTIEGLSKVTLAQLEDLSLIDLRFLERHYRQLNGYPTEIEEACFELSL